MKNTDRKLILLLWAVIIVLLAGSVAGGYILISHANKADQDIILTKSSNDSLKRQVDQLRAALKGTPTPTPPAIPPPPTAAMTSTPTPAPTATPKVKP